MIFTSERLRTDIQAYNFIISYIEKHKEVPLFAPYDSAFSYLNKKNMIKKYAQQWQERKKIVIDYIKVNVEFVGEIKWERELFKKVD